MEYWEHSNDTAIMKFYGTIGYWYQGADDFERTLRAIESKYKNLIIKVHCYGGFVVEGNAIFHNLSQTKLKTKMVVEGIAASMMFVLLTTPGVTVSVARNSMGMVHAPSGYVQGNAKDFFAAAESLKLMEKNFKREIKRKSKGKVDDSMIAKWLDGSDHWLDADKMYQLGIADEIIDPIDTSTAVFGTPDSGTEIEAVYSRYTALVEQSTKPNNNMDKKQLIQSLGLTGVTEQSSETAILEAATSKMNGLATENTNLKNDKQGAVKQQADILIEARAKEINSAFTEDQKTQFQAIATSAGIDALKTVLAAMKPTPNVTNLLSPEAKEQPAGQVVELPTAVAADRKDWTLDMWAEKDPEGLDKLSRSEDPKEVAYFKKIYTAKFPTATFS